ncbi:hypothetical protein K493DRAFT_298099 [Basidiobolus meristosporus CBS 931.73]|uniref:Adhesin domain-containing protein n=1 Tax=Basidiobolus meristosporus CBS 931.73 TaxID=1314790 RepID=A0A1Y1YVE6_9FUNG|nr:hypothetical protein K493DRAFT_298099 [Basidiobolus meristosporus CBS 931.73]|eukprot:ORY02008.1 hypothetical protein K493DRAFT_298099 [Basidiobolus meristosporus CBS 931.73]
MVNYQNAILWLIVGLSLCSALPVPPKPHTAQYSHSGIRLKASHRGQSRKTGKDVGFQVGIGLDIGTEIGAKDHGKGVKLAGHAGLSAVGRVFTDKGSVEGEVHVKGEAKVELGTDSTGKKMELNTGVGVNASVGGAVDPEPKSMPWDISMHDIDPEEFKRLMKTNQIK